MATFCYLVGDRATRTCALIDPAFETDRILEKADESSYRVTHIINTHAHADHTAGNGAIKADTGVHKVVYFAFGYEVINNATDRELVLQRVLDWILPPVTAVGGIPSAAARLDQNIPNPFNPSTKISFQVGQTQMVSLKVFDIAGQLERVLSEGVHRASDYEVTWDGCDQEAVRFLRGHISIDWKTRKDH